MNDADEPISKSQRKRDMLALQQLGEQLLQLPDRELQTLNLPAELGDAIALARRINSREGRRRQRQYIGKLMRHVDAQPIQQYLDDRARGRQLAAGRFHELEQSRDALIAGVEGAFEQLLERHPGLDRSHLRQLVRAAQRGTAGQDGVPTGGNGASRKLFRYLKSLADAEPPA